MARFRRWWAAVLTVVGIGCAEQAPDWEEHTQGVPFVFGYEEGLVRAKVSGKPAMVFFTATWCDKCKRMARESFNDPDVREILGGFVCVLVDGDREEAVTDRLNVAGYPHFLFTTSDGEEFARVSGYKPADEFRQILIHASRLLGAEPSVNTDVPPESEPARTGP